MTGLFASKEEKQERKALEEKVRNLLKKFEHGDLQQFCLKVIGKEPSWRKTGETEKKGESYDVMEPAERRDFEDFIWDRIKKKDVSYEQLQDYASRHNLVSRNYFSDRADLSSSNNVRKGFSESVKQDVLNKQNGKCANCGKHAASFQFDHIDGNRNNNFPNNCQALCPNCHDIKSRGLD